MALGADRLAGIALKVKFCETFLSNEEILDAIRDQNIQTPAQGETTASAQTESTSG
jgi:hypothetical protein